MDFNEIGEKELAEHNDRSKVAWYMGRDIQVIIEKCDAIYCCDGWENSRGCNVERECAKQYGLKILYQTPYDIRYDTSFIDMIERTRNQLTYKFYNFAKTDKEGPNSDVCQSLIDLIFSLVI